MIEFVKAKLDLNQCFEDRFLIGVEIGLLGDLPGFTHYMMSFNKRLKAHHLEVLSIIYS